MPSTTPVLVPKLSKPFSAIPNPINTRSCRPSAGTDISLSVDTRLARAVTDLLRLIARRRALKLLADNLGARGARVGDSSCVAKVGVDANKCR